MLIRMLQTVLEAGRFPGRLISAYDVADVLKLLIRKRYASQNYTGGDDDRDYP
jgi:hypothetical protein